MFTALQVVSSVPLTLAPTSGSVQLTHARGYLMLATETGVAIFNTTGSSMRRAPKMVSAHSYANIASVFDPGDMVSSGGMCDYMLDAVSFYAYA